MLRKGSEHRDCRNCNGIEEEWIRGLMIFKRVFLPVGQGAFFTEQFYDNNQDTLLYNVVYDCESKSSGILRCVRMINRMEYRN